MSYLRISTHPSIFARPLAPSEAMQNIEALLLLARPHVRTISERAGFLKVYRETNVILIR